ncbi:MAG: hypothetical protein AAF607_07320 [Pseudomonadota bacterium]
MTSAAPTRQQAIPGWLDGIAARPVEQHGHICMPIEGVYALIWPHAKQGGLLDQSNRLLAAAQHAPVLPARHGQRADVHHSINRRAISLAAELRDIGLCRQFSLMLPSDHKLPQSSIQQSADGLREKYAAIKAFQADMNAARARAHAFIESFRSVFVKPEILAVCGQNTIVIHMLVSEKATSLARKTWREHNPHMPEAALVGPLPPFAFTTL